MTCAACTATSGSITGIANAATCTLSGTTLTVTACATGYGIVSGACLSCTSPSTGTGIANCATCLGTVATTVGTPSGVTTATTFMKCLSCASGYIYYGGVVTNAAVPVCVSATAAVAATGFGAVATFGTVQGALVSSVVPNTNCPQSAVFFSQTTTETYNAPDLYPTCSAPSSGYWQMVDYETSYLVNTVPTGTATSGSFTNCAAGTYVGSTAGVVTGAIVCTLCSGTNMMYGTQCYAAIANCNSLASATTCASPAQGYNLVSALPVACVANATCTGGCASGYYLLSNGTCLLGAPLAACWYHVNTGVCAVCAAGYATPIPGCQPCVANCGNCSATACLGCNANFALQTNGSCVSTVHAAASSNALLSGLAFISMIFYYLF